MTDKKALVMDVTRDYILEVGIDAISMAKIAKKAHIPVGSIYYWFENKVDLINEVYLRARNTIYPQVREINKEHLVEGLKNYLYSYIDNCSTHSKELLLVANLHLLPIIKPENLMQTDAYIGDVRLSTLMELGIIKNVKPELIDLVLVGSIHEFVAYKICRNSPITEDDKKALAEMCWCAIKA